MPTPSSITSLHPTSTRYRRWRLVPYVVPPTAAAMTPCERMVRDIIGFAWDSTHHPYLPDRYARPLSIVAVPDQYRYAESLVLSLVGSPTRGNAFVTEQGRAGLLLPTRETLYLAELALLCSLVETVFGADICRIPIGSRWTSQEGSRLAIPFPSGKTWADVAMPPLPRRQRSARRLPAAAV